MRFRRCNNFFIKSIDMIKLICLFCSMLVITSCSRQDNTDAGKQEKINGLPDNIIVLSEETAEVPETLSSPEKSAGKIQRTPVERVYDGQSDYDIYDTVFSKDYYDYGTAGWQMFIRYPEVALREDMESYFIIENHIEGLQVLADMFFDNRTIEMEEEELKTMFYEHGFYLYLHNTELRGMSVRIVEIQELERGSLYPSVILIQTWDDEHIYLEDITGPLPRKIRSILTIDNKETPQMIIHSSGLSVDYVSEEELSFWEFRGDYWALIPMELEMDTSHVHHYVTQYPDLNMEELVFPTVYYRDGIVFRASMQYENKYGDQRVVRPGKMEETEKNRAFRLVALYDSVCRPCEDSNTYIQFTIK